MLRTGLFAFAALYAVGRFAAAHRINLVIIEIGIPIVINLPCVHAREQLRNGYMLRAARNAVRTRRTRNNVLRAVNFAYFLYCRALFFVKRLKVFHKRQIVAHLIQVAHAPTKP